MTPSAGKYVSGVTINSGVIQITYGGSIASGATAGGTTLTAQQLPAACRS